MAKYATSVYPRTSDLASMLAGLTQTSVLFNFRLHPRQTVSSLFPPRFFLPFLMRHHPRSFSLVFRLTFVSLLMRPEPTKLEIKGRRKEKEKCLKKQNNNSNRLNRIGSFVVLNNNTTLKPDGHLRNLMGLSFSRRLVYAVQTKIKCNSDSSTLWYSWK